MKFVQKKSSQGQAVVENKPKSIVFDITILPCYAIMPYSKVMAKEDFMSSLNKNRMNLTIEVLDLCMHAFASVRNQLK